jgi:hypothetical protein
MYQSLIWSAVPSDETRRLGAPFNAKDLQRLADALINRMRRDVELGSNFFGREVLVDETQAIELPGSKPAHTLLGCFIGFEAACPPVAVRQAVAVLQSDSRPA